MAYLFVEPVSLTSLLLFFTVSLLVLIYIVYFFIKRSNILRLKRMPTAFIMGFPNSGKTSLMKALSTTNVSFLNKPLNISHMDLTYDGVVSLKVVDPQRIFDSDGRLDEAKLNEVRAMDPTCIIGLIDVSLFSAPMENQIQFMMKIKEMFENKRLFLVASKFDRTSKDKIKIIERAFGKGIYKLRLERPREVESLRRDIIKYLSKKRL